MTILKTHGPRRAEITQFNPGKPGHGNVLATANTVVANEDRAVTFERIAAQNCAVELLNIVKGMAAKGHLAAQRALECIAVDVETLEAVYQEFTPPTLSEIQQEHDEHVAEDARLMEVGA